MDNLVKVTLTGDIMCCAPQLDACRIENGYDFATQFQFAGSLFEHADYKVGNLETPLAGEALGFAKEMYCFNTPESFAAEVKNLGIDLVSTANNHCMDRDEEGLFATLDALDRVGLSHIGTARTSQERESPFLANVNGFKLGFLAYTYGTNAFAHHRFLKQEHAFAVNLFQPEETLPGSIHLLNSMGEIGSLTEALYCHDNPVFHETAEPLRKQLKDDIAALRKNGADFVILIMHSGGQYNPEPDPFTRNLVDFICSEAPVDAIIGHHPHVPQICENRGRCPVAFSLGNFLYLPGSTPNNTRNLAEYSIVPTLTIRKSDQGKTMLDALDFSITKTITLPNGIPTVMPLYEYLQTIATGSEQETLIRDNQLVVNKFRNTPGVSVAPAKQYHFDLKAH